MRTTGNGARARTLAEQTARRRDVALAGHRGDVQAIHTFLDDVDPLVRATAMRALARADALPAHVLSATAADAEPLMRRAVAELIGHTTNADLDESVLTLLADKDNAVTEMAAWAAGERERPTTAVVDRLIELTASHEDSLVREAAVAALGAIGDERGLPAILTAMSDKATVRRRAISALAPFEGGDVDAALERALDDRDWQVRQAAEDLLA